MAIPKQKSGLQGNPVSPFFSAGRQTCRFGRTSASVTVGCRFVPEPPKPYKKCALNLPVLPCKRSTSLNTNRSLYFLFALLHFQNRCPAFSFLREAQNEKANIKSFGKGWRGCRGGRKEPFSKGFSFPPAGKVPQRNIEYVSTLSVHSFLLSDLHPEIQNGGNLDLICRNPFLFLKPEVEVCDIYCTFTDVRQV